MLVPTLESTTKAALAASGLTRHFKCDERSSLNFEWKRRGCARVKREEIGIGKKPRNSTLPPRVRPCHLARRPLLKLNAFTELFRYRAPKWTPRPCGQCAPHRSADATFVFECAGFRASES